MDCSRWRKLMKDVIVRPLSTVEYTSVRVYSTVDSGLTNLIQDHCSRLAGCVHSSVNKPGANARVSYDMLTHSRLYCRDREKK